MDELDRDQASTKTVAAAAAIAGAAALIALAITREKKSHGDELQERAADVKDSATTGGSQLAASLAELGPEVIAALDQHAPEVSRRLREGVPTLHRLWQDASANAAPAVERLTAAVDSASSSGARRDARKTLEAARASIVSAFDDQSDEMARIDLLSLSPAQSAAAHAAAAAVARAERALASGATLAGEARHRANDAAVDLAPVVRDAARQAAENVTGLWEQARSRANDTPTIDTTAASARASDALHLAGDRASEVTERVREKAAEIGDQAKGGAKHAAEVTVDTSKETSATLVWLAAALGVIFYVLFDEERRASFTRVTEEASFQIRELIRDFRGYDDEF